MSFEDLVRQIVREECQAIGDRLEAAIAKMGAPAAAAELLTVEQVVEELGGEVTESTVAEWCRARRLPAKKAGRKWLVRRSDLDLFLEREARPAVTGPTGPAPIEEQVTRIMGRVGRGGRNG